MPKIVWPQQPQRIREAWLRHHRKVPEGVHELLLAPVPPQMGVGLAKAFLRCYYAARDLERAERDLASGGEQTYAFAARALTKRLGELERRMAQLQEALD